MAVVVIDTIKPKNQGTFPVVEAADVKVTNDKRLDTALNEKANASTVEALSTAVAGKASQSDLTALSNTVSGKASQADLTALSNTVADKADKSALAETNTAVSGKQAALTETQLAACDSGITSELVTQIGTNTTAIAGKASQADLTALAAVVDTKADESDLTTATNSLQAQIDNIVSGSTADSEVINARVDTDGTTYSTLKARLDADENNAQTEISNVKSDIMDVQKTNFALNSQNNAHGFVNASGVYVANEAYRTTAPVKVASGETFSYKIGNAVSNLPIISVYSDAACTTMIDSVLGTAESYVESTYTAVSNCYVRFSFHNAYTEGNVLFNSSIPDKVEYAIDNAIDNINIPAIETEIKDVNFKLTKDNFALCSVSNAHGFINANGLFVANENYRTTSAVKVLSGETFSYKIGTALSTIPIVCVYSDAACTTKIDSVLGTAEKYVADTYTANTDCYIRFSYHNNYTDGYVLFSEIIPDKVAAAIDTINEELQKNEFTLYSVNNVNGFINANGLFISNDNYKTTPAIKVSSGESFRYKIATTLSTLPIICAYTDEECTTKLSTVMGNDSNYVEGTFTAATNCYVRFAYYKDYLDGYVLFGTDIPDSTKKAINNAIAASKSTTSLKIAIFGDSIFGNDGWIIDDLNATKDFGTVYNCAFGGTSISIRDGESDVYRYFDGEALWTAITTNDYTDQDEYISRLSANSQQHYATIKSLDFSDMDLIVLAYGTNDYTQGKTIAQINDAYNAVFEMIHSTYPGVRILVLSPIWRLISYDSTQNKYIDSDEMVYNVSTLKEIADAIITNCKAHRIHVYDSYSNVPLYVDDVPLYMNASTSDRGIEVPPNSGNYYSGVHPNQAGSYMYSRILHGLFTSMF